MTADELSGAMAALRWSAADLARELGVSATLVKRWEGVSQPPAEIPPAVATWLTARLGCVRATPPPIPHHQPPPAPIRWAPPPRRRGSQTEP